MPCRQEIFLGAREGRPRARGGEGTHHCSSSPSRSDTSLGTRRHNSHESHWTHASEHRGLSSASSAAEGPSPSSSAMMAAPAYEIGPPGETTAIDRDARTRGIGRDARGGSIDARGSIATCATRMVRRRGPGSDRRVVGWHAAPPAAPFSNGERRSVGRSARRTSARRAEERREKRILELQVASARESGASTVSHDARDTMSCTIRTKTRDREVVGSNPSVSLEPRAKRQHPRRRFLRRSRRRPTRRPRHADPRVPVPRGVRPSTKPIQNTKNTAAR